MASTKITSRQLIEALRLDREYFDHLKKVGYYPHKGQKPVINILLNSPVKQLFLQCSRNFGKSTTDAIDAVLHAGRIPRAKVYIIAPFRTLAEEIYYQSGLIDTIIPENWKATKDFDGTQLRWRLKNGSYIKLDGADNEKTVRGYKPTRLYCDEFQDWKKDVWMGMQPNLLAHDATVVFSGTPPKIENVYTETANFIKMKMLEKNPRFMWLKRTIYDNDRYSPDAVEEIRQGFLLRNEMDIWEREYMAEFVKGGTSYIFPQFYEEKHVRPMSWMHARMSRDKKHIQYHTVSDPSGSRHATLMLAYNPLTAETFVLDEIVETNYEKLSCGQLSKRITDREKIAYEGSYESPQRTYDEAAKLFAIEMADYGLYYSPTQKKQNDKSNNISLVRDAFINNKLFIADHCEYTISDVKNYHTDDKGKIVKVLDDCVDCLLYFFAESGYTFNQTPFEPSNEDKKREYIKASEGIGYWSPPVSTDITNKDLDLEHDLWH